MLHTEPFRPLLGRCRIVFRRPKHGVATPTHRVELDHAAPVRPKGAFGGPPRRPSRAVANKEADYAASSARKPPASLPKRFSGLLSNPKFWDTISLASASLIDADGMRGQGHYAAAQQRILDRKNRGLEEARQARFGKVLENMGMPGVGGLSPEQIQFMYALKRDEVADARDERNFNRGVLESDRGFGFRQDRAKRGDFESDRNYAAGREDATYSRMHNDRVFDAGRSDAAFTRMHQDRMFGLAEDRFDLETAEASLPPAPSTRWASPEEVQAAGYDPNTTTAQIDAKGNFKVIKEQRPLLGAEAMARAATGIPNMNNAVTSLEGLMENGNPGPTTNLTGLGRGGYKPGFDWGARAISAIPDFGVLEGLANFVGGRDYQQFEQAYNQFEAAALPIISGAAISESEGRRQLKAMKIQMGDNAQTRAAKLANMRNMSDALTAAAAGDTAGLVSIFDRSGSSPNERVSPLRPGTVFDDADIPNVPEGTRVRDTQTGEILEMRNGQLVPVF